VKNPEEVRRIECIAKAETALMLARTALDAATHNINLVVPMDHPIAKALGDARLSIAKADVLTTQTLARFKR
jgi:hypothetical protein